MINVKVIWFNRKSGEGMVKDSAGHTAMFYACNIPGKKTWFPETACMYFNEDQEIEVIQDENGFILPQTPGIFDEAKWNSLDQSRLAFKCDENGKAITGLFA
jgi:hypothetical protein